MAHGLLERHAVLFWQLLPDHAEGHEHVYEPTTGVQLPWFKHGDERQKLTWLPHVGPLYAGGHVQLNDVRRLLHVPP